MQTGMCFVSGCWNSSRMQMECVLLVDVRTHPKCRLECCCFSARCFFFFFFFLWMLEHIHDTDSDFLLLFSVDVITDPECRLECFS